MTRACHRMLTSILYLSLFIILGIRIFKTGRGMDQDESRESKKKIDDLIYDMKTMRSTRFIFSKRMEVKSRVKSFMVNCLTVASLFISIYLLANASGVSDLSLKRISIAIIGLSLLALWMSLDTPPAELARRAANAHQCGREISEIFRSYKYGSIDTKDAVLRYENTISKYPDNHDSIDRNLALFKDRHNTPAKAAGLNSCNTSFYYSISCYSSVILSVIWIISILLLLFIFPI